MSKRPQPKQPAPPAERATGDGKKDGEQPQDTAPRGDAEVDGDFGPPSRFVVAVPADAQPDGEWYETADVAHEPWFADRAGDDQLHAYRTGRAVHAIGWLTLAAQLRDADWFGWQYDQASRTQANLDRMDQFDERCRRARRSRRSLTVLLVESAHRFAPEVAERELVPAIASHDVALESLSNWIEDWRAALARFEEIGTGTGDYGTGAEQNLAHFPFDDGPNPPETRIVLQTFETALPPRLRDLLHLGLAVDALFRGPVRLRGPRHHWLGMVPSAPFRVRSEESGKVVGLCSRLGFGREVVEEVRSLVESPRGPESIVEIDNLIRRTLCEEVAHPRSDHSRPVPTRIPGEVEQPVSADATEPKGGDAGVAPNEGAAFEIEQPPSTVGRITMEEFEWMTEILNGSTRSTDIQKLIDAYFERFKKDIGRNRMYALRNQARKGIRLGSSDNATGEQPKP